MCHLFLKVYRSAHRPPIMILDDPNVRGHPVLSGATAADHAMNEDVQIEKKIMQME
jgi:hypothetical protein